MVLLIPSEPLLSALKDYKKLSPPPPDSESVQCDPTPSYLDHQTVKKISSTLIAHTASPENAATYRLSRLLQGCAVYIPPKPPRPEPTEEYKALMAHLRDQAEAESYRTMLNPADHTLLAQVEEEEYTMRHLQSDLSLIVNVLFSILATGGAVWAVASSWAVPERFGLAFVAAIIVGIAEVVVLGSYYRKIEEAKVLENKKAERKEILRTWEVGAGKKVD